MNEFLFGRGAGSLKTNYAEVKNWLITISGVKMNNTVYKAIEKQLMESLNKHLEGVRQDGGERR